MAAATYSPKHHATAGTAYTTPASTALFRRLVWEGTVPIEVRIDPKELPAGSDRGLESYYVQAPRVSYLPLLIQDIKRHLTELVVEDGSSKFLKEDEWWFEAEGGVLMKWHWPVGLLYDHYSTSVSPAVASAPLTLHLAAPPTDKLLLSPSIDACKQAFMGQLKEADFLRWGSTKRVTGLRKPEQDGLWDGVRDHNFDDYWRVAVKITPTATPNQPMPGTPMTSHSTIYRPASVEPGAHATSSNASNTGTISEPTAPMDENGRPTTLGSTLFKYLPLLFPSPRLEASDTRAYALVQGILPPSETEMAWLGACMAGADGWVNICIGLRNVPHGLGLSGL
ncbi:autophagy protein 5 [Auriculariales sp. MPI-PUGE-AT-0066]|nr:autophagy protein 5 [Auriculariales sp. MPI-PUGE-AT-0066]